MPTKLFYLLPAAMLFGQPAWPESPMHLSVDVEAAVVTVSPLGYGRKLVKLPALEFHLSIGSKCEMETDVASISISIADTRRTLAGAEVDDTGRVSAVIAIPARQLSPVAVEGFCPTESSAGTDTLLIKDALTANLSLRCAGAESESITYASHALDLTLQCEMATVTQGESPSLTAR